MEIHHLRSTPEPTVRKWLATGVPIYLLVNPIEYHGPHLRLENDLLLSEAVTQDLHRRLMRRHPEWPLLLAPPIHAGTGTAPGPGSVNVPYLTVRRLVLQACRNLEALGARRVVLMTFHAAPLHNMALDAGARYLASRGVRCAAPSNAVLKEMLDYRPGKFDHAFDAIEDAAARAHIRDNFAKDFHGGFFETSLVLHYRPDAVAPEHRGLKPCPAIRSQPLFSALSALARRAGRARLAAELRFASLGAGWLRLKPSPPGYTGWPNHANARSGAAFAEIIVERYLQAVESAFEGGPSASMPRPILRWVRPSSLNGRVRP